MKKRNDFIIKNEKDMATINYNNPNDPWMYDPCKGMNDNERLKAGCLQGAAFIVMLLAGLLLCALLGSCTTTKYIEVEKVRNDTVLQSKTLHDSIYVHDSISIKEQGDTVMIEKWHTKYVLNEKHDTTYIATHDTIPKPYPVEVEVPAELTWWQETRLHIANIVLWVLAFIAIFYTGKICLKKILP